MNGDLISIVENLKLLKEDPILVKRVKEKIGQVILLLQQNDELNVDKAIRELSEFDYAEIPSYDRTLLWDVISMLEGATSLNKF